MADLKYYDGTQWITLKGAGVDLTQSVNVDTTDCDIGPADSTGSLTKDGAEVDGVQSYKLDLTLPRPLVVTTSDGVEPADACDGDFWVDESEGGSGGGGQDLGDNEVRAWVSSGSDVYGQPIKVLQSVNVISVTQETTAGGVNRVTFLEPFKTNLYAAIGAIRENDTTSNVITLIFRDDLFTTTYADYISSRRNATQAAWTNNIPLGISAVFYETRS